MDCVSGILLFIYLFLDSLCVTLANVFKKNYWYPSIGYKRDRKWTCVINETPKQMCFFLFMCKNCAKNFVKNMEILICLTVYLDLWFSEFFLENRNLWFFKRKMTLNLLGTVFCTLSPFEQSNNEIRQKNDENTS